MPDDLIKCTRCGELKDKSDFFGHKSTNGKIHYYECKSCKSEQTRNYYRKNHPYTRQELNDKRIANRLSKKPVLSNLLFKINIDESVSKNFKDFELKSILVKIIEGLEKVYFGEGKVSGEFEKEFGGEQQVIL